MGSGGLAGVGMAVFSRVFWWAERPYFPTVGSRGSSRSAHSNCVLVLPSCMHIAEENHLSDFQAHFLKEHAQCGKREVFIEFFNRAEEDDLVFHDLDHISTFKNSMLDEFCKLFGHLGFSSGALPSSTLLKGIIESLQKGCSPAVSRDRIAVWIQKLLTFSYAYPSTWWGTGTCPFPTPRSRVRSRSPKHADAKGGSPRPSPKKAARTEATSTPARGGDAAPPAPPAASVPAPGPVQTEQGKPLLQSALGLAQAGWKAIKGPFARAARSDQAGCGQVGVVCLADVSLSPGWTECFASEVGPRLILRISDIWPPEMPKLLGMWPLILVGLVKGIIQFQYWTEQMGAPMPASAQNLRMNGQLWTTSEGLVVTLGPVKGSTVKPGPP
ncbi:hypothetical protein PAPYR_12549 [Paratrimastix pyriformis]|uniref:Uncharacterized protein n=1 Tax=Paratrimastix pyriformis TaxID=342808 RepID=A0ABQ8U1N9_9EUKA|nr:hypothetical protein PAPYR_12549 [Paratrimastix pyriformis]